MMRPKTLYQIPFLKLNGRNDNWNTYDPTVTHALVFIDDTGSHFLIAASHSHEEAQGMERVPNVRRALADCKSVETYIIERLSGPLTNYK